jgi:hypothetical protein
MLEAATIIARLTATVPALASVEGAAELAALLASPVQVWTRTRAHVVPLGIKGGAVLDAAGGFVQAIDVAFAVYLSFPSHGDAKGGRKLDDVSTLQNAVIATLCGWVPAGVAAMPPKATRSARR